MAAQEYVDTLDRVQSASRRDVGDLVVSALRRWSDMSESDKTEVYELLRAHEDSNLMFAHNNTQCLWESTNDDDV